jgi:alpha-L-fucosidase
MATNSNWTVVFDDKLIIKQKGDAAGTSYTINDDAFWSQSKFTNIWAIQHGASVSTDEVEYRDNTPHTTYADANLGDFNEFITRWDAAHLNVLQTNWDFDNIADETPEQKSTRLGARPTSYSSI